jgi:glucan phosphoethanolaminetransferase (alkaline phosphatase superfamily)
MDKKLKDRLVGGFGGAGIAIILYIIFVYAVAPNFVTKLWSWSITIALIGVILVSVAVYFYFKKVTVINRHIKISLKSA